MNNKNKLKSSLTSSMNFIRGDNSIGYVEFKNMPRTDLTSTRIKIAQLREKYGSSNLKIIYGLINEDFPKYECQIYKPPIKADRSKIENIIFVMYLMLYMPELFNQLENFYNKIQKGGTNTFNKILKQFMEEQNAVENQGNQKISNDIANLGKKMLKNIESDNKSVYLKTLNKWKNNEEIFEDFVVWYENSFKKEIIELYENLYNKNNNNKNNFNKKIKSILKIENLSKDEKNYFKKLDDKIVELKNNINKNIFGDIYNIILIQGKLATELRKLLQLYRPSIAENIFPKNIQKCVAYYKTYELSSDYALPVRKSYKNFAPLFTNEVTCYEKLIKNNYYFAYSVDKAAMGSPKDNYNIYHYLVNKIQKFNLIKLTELSNEKPKGLTDKFKNMVKDIKKKFVRVDNKFIWINDEKYIILTVSLEKDSIILRSIDKELMEGNKNFGNVTKMSSLEIKANGKEKVSINCLKNINNNDNKNDNNEKNNNKNLVDKIVIEKDKDTNTLIIRVDGDIMYNVVKYKVDDKNLEYLLYRLCPKKEVKIVARIRTIDMGKGNEKLDMIYVADAIPFELVLLFCLGSIIHFNYNNMIKNLFINKLKNKLLSKTPLYEKLTKKTADCNNTYLMTEYRKILKEETSNLVSLIK